MRRAGLRINRYELLLAAVISARATSFIFSKLALEAMDTFNLLAVRCLLAFAVLAVLFFRRLRHIGRRTLLAGAAIGTAFFLCMSAELTALHTASSSSVSLLENCAIVFVPLIDALLLRRLPEKRPPPAPLPPSSVYSALRWNRAGSPAGSSGDLPPRSSMPAPSS